MNKKRSLWTLVVSLSVALSAMPAWAQDEEPADGAADEAAPDEGAAVEGGGDVGVEAEAGAEGEAGAEVAAEGDAAAGAGTDAMIEGEPGALTKANWPTALVDRPITNAKGMIEIRGDINVNLSKDAVGKPFTIAPDVYYGVSDVLMVGLVHSTGLCLSGKENGCAKVYNDVGVDSVFSFLQGSLNVGAHVGVLVRSFDPEVVLGANLGVLGKKSMGKLAITFDPKVYVGFTQRDAGNKEGLDVPVQIDFQATPKLAVGLMTGIGGPLDGFGDFFAVPVGLQALFGMSNKLDFGARFVLPMVAGGSVLSDAKLTGVDARAVTLFVNARL